MGKKLKNMASIIWSTGADRFGKKEPKVKTYIQPKENRRVKEIAILRGDLWRMKKAFHGATADERSALTDIRDNLRECIKTLQRAKYHRRDRKERFHQESFQMSVETSGHCNIRAAESNKGGGRGALLSGP